MDEEWYNNQEIQSLCQEHGVEALINEAGKVMFFMPKPDPELQAQIEQWIPAGADYVFTMRPNNETLGRVALFLRMSGMTLIAMIGDSKGRIILNVLTHGPVDTDKTSPFWQQVDFFLKNDATISSYEIHLERMKIETYHIIKGE
jgi:hypothetical protein